MVDIAKAFNPNVVTKFLCFPYSLSFNEYFSEFDNATMWNMRDIDINEKVYDFVGRIDKAINDHIKEQELPVFTEIDWRFAKERTSDGFSVETMQPIIKVSGTPDDIGKIFLTEVPQFNGKFEFAADYETALKERAQTDSTPRNFLRDLWYIGNGLQPAPKQGMVAAIVKTNKRDLN